MIIKSNRVAVQVWDTAGQEKYFTITTGYYRQADAVLLVCDLTSAESFERLEKWIAEVRSYARANTPCALLANKCDLESDTRQVDMQALAQWARSYGMPCFEVWCRRGVL